MKRNFSTRIYSKTVFSRFFIFVTISELFSISCTNEKESSDRPVPPAKDSIEIEDGWARPASRGMTGGCYLTIYNETAEADTLTGVSTEVAESVEIHESFRQENGVSGMRPAGKLSVEAGSRLEMKPGGYHVMLMQLKQDLAVGDSISLTLYFAKNDSIITWIPVSQGQ